jgi:ABC-2 type transport system permease protein
MSGERAAAIAPARTFTGTGTLVRFILRRDRLRIPLWVIGIVVLVVVSAASIVALYPTQQDIQTYVDLMEGNPTLTAVNGPGYGFEDPNQGVVLVNETTIWAAIACGLMSVFLLVRHTRTEEESERADLIRSCVVGRHAPLAAAAVVAVGVNLVIGVLSFVGVVAIGFGATGSLVFVASFVAAGLVFAGVAAVASQIFTGARAALGVSVGAVGLAYAMRAVGDLGPKALSWLSPIGWAHLARPFAGARWWVLGMSLAVAFGLMAAARAMTDRRDLGGGMLPQRLGRAEAPGSLSNPLGLALRMQRGSVTGWSAGLFLLGVVYGAVGRDIEDMIRDNPDFEEFIRQVGGASITDSYIAYTLTLGAMLAAGYAIAAVLRLRGEESEGRADVLLSGPVSRPNWMSGQLAMSAGGTVVLLGASGLGTGIGLSAALGDWTQLPRVLLASLVHAPAVLVLVGLAVALFGALPRWAAAAWAGLALVVVVGLFGDLFRVPHWLRMLSPLQHTPGLPAESFRTLPVVVLLAVAGLLTGAGVLTFRQRDVASG